VAARLNIQPVRRLVQKVSNENTSRAEFQPIASPIHTLLILSLQGVLAYLGKIRADHLREAASINHVHLYVRTMVSEWLVLGLILVGVWLHHSPLTAVLGERWRSARQVLTDTGVAVVFLICSIAVLSIMGGHGKAADASTQFLFPHGKLESTLWILMSLTAGICEEAIFRGYLQCQFTAFSRNTAIGIVLSAATFGAAHAYQGLRHAVQIAILGAMLGALAWWRKTVRPGMIAHALEDVIAIFVRH
jgi:membrane protease YdiL (CAAX protease family)